MLCKIGEIWGQKLISIANVKAMKKSKYEKEEIDLYTWSFVRNSWMQ